MNDRKKYRTLILALGILVAIIVAATLLSRQDEDPQVVRNLKTPAIPKPPSVVKKAVKLLLSVS